MAALRASHLLRAGVARPLQQTLKLAVYPFASFSSGAGGKPPVILDSSGSAMAAPAPAPTPTPATTPTTATQEGGAQPLVFDVTSETFRDVVMGSKVPVILDFWADWCGPCKDLTPRLEAAVRAAGGAVVLGKINTDAEPGIAQAMQIKSLPTLIGIVGGKAAGQLQGAVPNDQLAAFMQQLVEAGGGAMAGPGGEALAALQQLVEAADAAMVAGSFDDAVAALSTAAGKVAEEQAAGEASHLPADKLLAVSAEVVAAQLRLALVTGDAEGAQAAAGVLRSSAFMKVAAASPRVATSLSQHALMVLIDSVPAAKTTSLEDAQAAVLADVKDPQAYLLLAQVAAAHGALDATVESALTAVKLGKGDVRDEARKLLVGVFDALGPTQPLVVDGRKRLSQYLFM